MNKDIIKLIAMITMTINHIAIVFMKPDSWIYYLLCGIGYFTGIVMVDFLLSGYHQTKSRKKYFLRLLLFGVISQIPYTYAFTQNGGRLNMLFSLCICFVIIWVLEEADNKIYQVIIITLAFIVSFYCDWPLLAPLLTLLLYFGEKSPEKKLLLQGIFVVVFWVLQFWDGQETFSLSTNLKYSTLSIVGVVIAFGVLNCLYDSKSKRGRSVFLKWFFYLFYPLHLLIIGIAERM